MFAVLSATDASLQSRTLPFSGNALVAKWQTASWYHDGLTPRVRRFRITSRRQPARHRGTANMTEAGRRDVCSSSALCGRMSRLALSCRPLPCTRVGELAFAGSALKFVFRYAKNRHLSDHRFSRRGYAPFLILQLTGGPLDRR